MKKILLTFLVLAVSTCSGCFGSGKKNSNSIVHFVDDQTLAIKASLALGKEKGLTKNTHISVLSHKQAVLLVGQTPTLDLKIRAEEIVSKLSKVGKIYNQLSVKKPTGFATRAKDAWITTQVKAKLFAEPKLSSTHIKVVTEDKVVYLMGTPNHKDKERAIDIVRNMKNVNQVVDVFNISEVEKSEIEKVK